MDIVFLDANVLFSAAYRRESGLKKLWALDDAALITSRYALEEARRNLEEPARQRLERLASRVEIVAEAPDRPLPAGIELPEKDHPILQAAIAAAATHLLTGDVTHFGRYFGHTVAGLLILTPGDYPRQRGLHRP
ncbi:MAG: PIN domain-containing protein [Gemmatimonadales bacterium]|jgi:predicted nucleic acid-binding protein